MKIFMLIMFGLATIRTIAQLTKTENIENGREYLAALLLAITTTWAYIILLNEMVILK